jgi:hypothetical protein
MYAYKSRHTLEIEMKSARARILQWATVMRVAAVAGASAFLVALSSALAQGTQAPADTAQQ